MLNSLASDEGKSVTLKLEKKIYHLMFNETCYNNDIL